jgi:hypothetical protein
VIGGRTKADVFLRLDDVKGAPAGLTTFWSW